MNNFVFENATRFYFGTEGISRVAGELAAAGARKVMVAFGGSSAKRTGIFDQVAAQVAAADAELVEFGGIMANPTLAKVMAGAELARERGVDYILAVGGGSVMDCCKMVALAAVDALPEDDAWTGEAKVAESWKAVDGGVAVDVAIAPNDSLVVVLTTDELAAEAEAATPMEGSVELAGWSLSVESWTPGATVLDTEKTAIDLGAIDALKPWNELDEKLEHVSGVGTYTATFEMPAGFAEGQAAWLHMGYVKDAYGVKVNGTEVLVDQASGDADVSALVKPGENKIEVNVASSLMNAVLENNKGILNDDGHVLDDRSPSGYGLTEQVTIDGSATRA